MASKTYKYRDDEGIHEVEYPSIDQIRDWVFDVEDTETPDGCFTEPDGYCPHGLPSWLLIMGMI